ncbi:serrate RNA effector molecule homolog isoform X2 [Hemicordylus capensis]|uniref:serrate RNA effector molecule homolog isoform X2 n=1 Tax=Hemicordylus capensis TaxID=884348 RepID=UPI0023039C38|nr:serrate RNA effector molecule homolog isoform X2 [Hemicordylus capensis]
MGDSDDEYDRRRRDKFRRERSDYDRSREREDRRRDDWSDREWDRGRERRSRGEYRDYDRNRRERFSPPRHELSPPQKRMRRDWDEHTADPYHTGYEMPYSGVSTGPTYGPPQPWAHPEMHVTQHHILPIQARLGNIAEVDLGIAPPVMKSFKEFLLSLDDSVDETEAVKRYNDYKLDFRRQQMQDFFLAHKDEEWFRSKYHPDEAGRRKQDAHNALQNRLRVFLYLMENSWLENLQLDIDKASAIIKVLDAAVIKMEGGTENDLKILDQEEEEERQEKAEPGKKEESRLPEPDRKASEKDGKKEEAKKANDEEVSEEVAKKASEDEEKRAAEQKEEPDKEAKKTSHKRKRKRSGNDSYDEGSVSESDSESESGRPEEDDKGEEEPKEEKAAAKEGEESPKAKEKEGEPKPRPLHKTCSLFMRNIAPNIAQAEIVALCKRYPGFMRVALSDPQPERRFFRRGWVTFDRSVNIKEICWNLQNIRLKECELSPVVNRDLARRVRNVSGITQHKQILRNDIKLAAKLIHTMDARTQLWGSGDPRPAAEVSSLPSQNPILKNITDYLIEEVSAEEEELLGKSGEPSEEPPKEGNPAEINVEREEKLVKVLDKLLLYLRIVHSVDYYNNSEYLSEDEMPNRCGIIHVRGPIPPNRVTHGEMTEWQKTFEDKLTPLFSVRESLSEEEAQKMGKKDPEQEVEKFVTANTQELGKDKWLCPLSGKKFKGPEFVRKHIFNKHAEKIEEVKKEVAFFNNFLMDAKRPALPELKPNQPPAPGQGGPPYPPAPYAAGRGNYDTFRGQGGYLNKPRNRMVRGDPRAIVEYRDLDAPEDVDFF